LPVTRSETADAVIIGGGLAGHAAALRCAERGLQPLILEQGAEEAYLCNSRITIGAFQIALTDMRSGKDVLRRAIEDATHGHVDAVLADSFSGAAGAAIAWLEAQGVALIPGGSPAENLVVLAPPVPRLPGLHWPGRAGDVMLRRLSANLAERGGTLRRGFRARDLIMDGARCAGVTATSGDDTHRIAARAVVIADGGFQANPELVRRYISPRPDRLLQRNAGTGRGDGLLMAQAVGAKLTGLDRFYGHVQSRDALHDPRLWPYPSVDFPVAAGIAVDHRARRFTDEGLAGIAIANAIARLDDPLLTWAIFDQATWEESAKTYLMSANPFLQELSATLHRAGTLAGVAALAGLPADALTETVAGFNRALGSGGLSRLDPPRTADNPHLWAAKPMPIMRPPIYAVPLCAGLTYTMGGLAVDAGARVLRDGGHAIAGLYAAGGSIGGTDGGPYTGYTGGLAKALVFGLIAGDSIAADHGLRAPGARSD
jgi:fumarate reductase flavoprotein subunit